MFLLESLPKEPFYIQSFMFDSSQSGGVYCLVL
jgi:hypothetical protein